MTAKSAAPLVGGQSSSRLPPLTNIELTQWVGVYNCLWLEWMTAKSAAPLVVSYWTFVPKGQKATGVLISSFPTLDIATRWLWETLHGSSFWFRGNPCKPDNPPFPPPPTPPCLNVWIVRMCCWVSVRLCVCVCTRACVYVCACVRACTCVFLTLRTCNFTWRILMRATSFIHSLHARR